ncbi:MAG: BamA/TamA family outer membrane protein [Fidelibacterota bacterium]
MGKVFNIRSGECILKAAFLVLLFQFLSSPSPLYSMEKDSSYGNSYQNRYFEFGGDNQEDIKRFSVSYNRTEGLFIGFGIPRRYDNYRRRSNLAFYGFAGYGFASDEWRYKAGLSRRFFRDRFIEIGIEGYSLTETEDEWIIPAYENSLSAFLLHEDFYDFYERVGYTLYLKNRLNRYIYLHMGYFEDDQKNMAVNTAYSVFRKGKTFRPIPEIREGMMKSLFLTLRSSRRHYFRGWLVYFNIILNEDGFFSDNFDDFSRYIIDVRRYQPFGFEDMLNLRLRIGFSRGKLPPQYKFDLGGISTLRGFRYKEFSDGEKMVLGNVEYRLNPVDISGLSDILFFNPFMLVIFADAGFIWSGEERIPGLSELKKDVGIALANSDDSFRLNFAKAISDKERKIIVTFRINSPF